MGAGGTAECEVWGLEEEEDETEACLNRRGLAARPGMVAWILSTCACAGTLSFIILAFCLYGLTSWWEVALGLESPSPECSPWNRRRHSSSDGASDGWIGTRGRSGRWTMWKMFAVVACCWSRCGESLRSRCASPWNMCPMLLLWLWLRLWPCSLFLGISLGLAARGALWCLSGFFICKG